MQTLETHQGLLGGPKPDSKRPVGNRLDEMVTSKYTKNELSQKSWKREAHPPS